MGSVFVALILVITGFVAVTWVRFTGFSERAWEVIPVILIGGFIPATLLSFRFRHPLLRAYIVLSSVSLGFLSYGLLAAGLCWLIAGAGRVAGHPPDARTLADVLYGAAALATLYGMANASAIRITRLALALPNLPPAWRGRSVALVSDIHLGNIRGSTFARRIVSRLRELKPDAVFISGDLFDGTHIDVEKAVRPLAGLSVPAGIFFVGGNHDDFGDRPRYLAALGGVGLRALNNEKVTVDGLQIAGVHDDEAGDPGRFREILRQMGLDRSRAAILLAHRPSNLAIPEEAGFSLQLSGHTHSGQFWPWTLIVARIYGSFAFGLNRFGRMLVYTSSGVGTWGPPLRLGTKSEIVAIRLS